MAYTKTLIEDSVHGNHRVRIFTVVADAAVGNIDTGLNKVSAVSISVQTAATAGFAVYINKSTTAAVSNGKVAFASAAANDNFNIICWGQ